MIPAPPDGIPWLAWAIVVIALALIGGVPAWITARNTKRGIDEVRELYDHFDGVEGYVMDGLGLSPETYVTLAAKIAA